jgi:hypothetical protein
MLRLIFSVAQMLAWCSVIFACALNMTLYAHSLHIAFLILSPLPPSPYRAL